MKLLIILLLVTSVFAGDSLWYEKISWEDLDYSMYSISDSFTFTGTAHFIAGPVTVNCSTGEVEIAEGADISSASIKFWRSLEAAYPYLFEGELGGRNKGKN